MAKTQTLMTSNQKMIGCDNQKSSEIGQQHRIHGEWKTTNIVICTSIYISFKRMLVRNCVFLVSTCKEDAKRSNGLGR